MRAFHMDAPRPNALLNSAKFFSSEFYFFDAFGEPATTLRDLF